MLLWTDALAMKADIMEAAVRGPAKSMWVAAERRAAAGKGAAPGLAAAERAAVEGAAADTHKLSSVGAVTAGFD